MSFTHYYVEKIDSAPLSEYWRRVWHLAWHGPRRFATVAEAIARALDDCRLAEAKWGTRSCFRAVLWSVAEDGTATSAGIVTKHGHEEAKP